MIKQLLVALFIFVSCGTFSQEDTDYAHIIRFDGTYQINKDCSMLITERIAIFADGYEINHGIYRDIPLTYDYQGGQTTVDFSLVSITRDGKKEDYHTEWLSNGIRIYFGNAEIRLDRGYYTYDLTYKVNHVLRLLDNADELYWNTNGNGWKFQIDTLTARVLLPPGITFKQSIAYTGEQGANGNNYTVEQVQPNELFFETKTALTSYEGLTFAASWDKNQLIYPSAFENFMYWIKSHALWVLLIFMVLFLLIRSTLLWSKYGRDPKPGTIMPQYDAPEGFSPADVYAVMNRGLVTSTAFTGQIASLGAKGWMKIKQEDIKGAPKYTFTRTENPKEDLTSAENQVYQAFFSNKDSFSFYENTFNASLKKGMDDLETNISRSHGEKYRTMNSRINGTQYLFLFLFILVAFGLKFLFGGSYFIIGIMAAVGIGLNVLFGYLFEQPTPEGRKVMDHILGLKLFIEYADKKRIQFNNPPDLNFETFERLLPYAIVLGLAKEWEGQFNPVELQTGYGMTGFWFAGMGLYGFSSFSSGAFSSAISASSIPPTSSSGGSFSGGVVFSGVGGGGGGGGGW